MVDAALTRVGLPEERTWTGLSAVLARYRHRLAMLVLGAVALVVGWLLLPGADERFAALERDGRTSEALRILEDSYARGDRSQRTLFLLQRIYETYGARDMSRKILEELAAKRPRDLSLQRTLAQLYRQTQDEEAYIAALRRQLELRYAEPTCRELIGVLRRRNETEEEQRTLISCRQKGYRRADDLTRLAFLHASDGDLRTSSEILSAIDDRRWLVDGRDRLLLFSAMLELRRDEDAVRRALRWMRGQVDAPLTLDLINQLIEKRRYDLATQMAREIGTPGDEIQLAVGEVMIEQVQLTAANPFLNGWLNQAIERKRPLDAEILSRFITAAIDVANPALALKAAEHAGFGQLDIEAKYELAEALAVAGLMPEFDRAWMAINESDRERNPLLAATVAYRIGRKGEARILLARVAYDELTVRRQALYRLLAERVRSPLRVTALLNEPAAQLPANLAPAQARARAALRRVAVAKKSTQRRRPDRPGIGAPAQQPGLSPLPGLVFTPSVFPGGN